MRGAWVSRLLRTRVALRLEIAKQCKQLKSEWTSIQQARILLEIAYNDYTALFTETGYVQPEILFLYDSADVKFAARLLHQGSPRLWSRSLATEVDTVEASVENSLKETHSIESLIQDHTTNPVPQINRRTHRTFDYKTDETVRRHLVIKHQSNP